MLPNTFPKLVGGGKDIRATALAGKTGTALKSEVLKSFTLMVSQNNTTCVTLGEKGKEVTRRYLMPKKRCEKDERNLLP